MENQPFVDYFPWETVGCPHLPDDPRVNYGSNWHCMTIHFGIQYEMNKNRWDKYIATVKDGLEVAEEPRKTSEPYLSYH